MQPSTIKEGTVLPHPLRFPDRPDITDLPSLHGWLIDVHRQLDNFPPVPKSKLCEVCSRIPFDTIFSRDSRSTFTIGDISEVQLQSRQYCALCRLCKAYLDSIAGNPEFKNWLALPSPCVFQLQSRTPILYNGPPDDDADWAFLPVPVDVFLGPYASLDLNKAEQYDEYIDRPPKFIIQHKSVLGPSQLLAATDKGTFLSHDSLQRIMRGALECKQSHRSCDGMAHSPIQLSYIWGESAGRDHGQLESLSNDSDVKKLPQALPQTIKDVLQVARWLGLRYVWIDAYCIQQNDPVELQNAVMHMDSVYENALLTICTFWADIAAGLYGVSVPFKDQNCHLLPSILGAPLRDRSLSNFIIQSEATEAYITQGSPEKFPLIKEFMWRVVHPKGDAFMDFSYSWLTWKSALSGMLLDTRAIDALDVRDSIARVRLVLLARIHAIQDAKRDGRQEIGDTIIAMAITGSDNAATAEKLGIIAVPLFYWLDSKPKLGKVVVV